VPPLAGLAVGVVSVGSAALLVRLAGEAPPLTIGAYRMAIGSAVVVLGALLFARADLGTITRGDLPALFWSGVFLALHFATWIASLRLTSVASSVVLVTTSPLWIALAAPFTTGDPVSRRALLGVLTAITGAGIIAAGDAGIDPGALAGNLLALAGAWAIAGHRLTGRRLRARLSLMAFVATVYPIAAVCLVSAAVLAGEPLSGFSATTYHAIAALGLVPQVIGHSAFNWALGYLSPVTVSTALTTEPIAASLLAWAVLGEPPTATQAAGGVVVLTGVYITLRADRR
jgi:drug/metabolite transporter (DMT)-like permease